VIVHGDATGVDELFATAAKGLGVRVEAHRADWEGLGKTAASFRNGEMIRAGAAPCLAVQHFLMNIEGTKDCVCQVIEAGIPTKLIDSEKAVPMRLAADYSRLEQDANVNSPSSSSCAFAATRRPCLAREDGSRTGTFSLDWRGTAISARLRRRPPPGRTASVWSRARRGI
jgi:hypothetical protein